MRKRKKEISVFCLILVGIFVIMFIMNYYTCIATDDYCYALNLKTWNRISSYKELFESLSVWRQSMNARLFTGFIVQFGMSLGFSVIRMLNALTFAGLIFLIYFHSKGHLKSIDLFWLFVSFMLVWFVTPDFGEVFLWISGSSNYLYGAFGLLLYLVPFTSYMYINEKKEEKLLIKIIKFIGMVLAGFVAGALVETISAAAVLGSILYTLFYYFIEKEKIQWWMIGGIIGTITGAIYLIIAPAQASRIKVSGGVGSIKEWIYRFIHLSLRYIQITLPLFLLTILLAWIIYKQREELEHPIDKNELGLIFVWGGDCASGRI